MADFKCDAYLQVRKVTIGWSPQARVVKVTQTKPDVLAAGCVLVKVKLVIPREVFEPFEPVAEVVIPASLVQHDIQVEAVEVS